VLCRDIIGVCGKNYTEPINILRGQNAEILALNLAVHMITTKLQRVKHLASSLEFLSTSERHGQFL
jgi:hypothetical protein